MTALRSMKTLSTQRAFPAHADSDSGLFEYPGERLAGKLRPLMTDQAVGCEHCLAGGNYQPGEASK